MSSRTALSLLGQLLEHFAQMRPKALVQHLPAALWDENNVVLALPISSGLSFHTRPSRFSLMCAWRLTSWNFLDYLIKLARLGGYLARNGDRPSWQRNHLERFNSSYRVLPASLRDFPRCIADTVSPVARNGGRDALKSDKCGWR